MKTPKFIVDTVQRIEMVLSKNRSSLSTDDVFLLERCIFYFKKMRKAKSDQEKKEFLSKGVSYWMKFFLKNELLNNNSELFKMLGKITD
jgi:hypothetical protein